LSLVAFYSIPHSIPVCLLVASWNCGLALAITMKKFRLNRLPSLILRISQSLFLTRRITSSAEVSLSKYQLPVIVIKVHLQIDIEHADGQFTWCLRFMETQCLNVPTRVSIRTKCKPNNSKFCSSFIKFSSSNDHYESQVFCTDMIRTAKP